MKSTITINSVTAKTWQDKNFQVIIFDGNKEGSSWKDDFEPFKGQTIEADVNTNAKGKFILALVAGASAPTPTPTTPQKQSCECTDGFQVRKTSFMLTLEKLEKSGATIDSPKFWKEVIDTENYLVTGDVPHTV